MVNSFEINARDNSICSSRNHSNNVPHEKVCFQQHVGLKSNTCSKRVWFGRESRVFVKNNYERQKVNVRAFSTLHIGLRCHMRSASEEHVFRQTKHVFGYNDIICYLLLEGGFGRFRRYVCDIVKILTWDKEEQCW